MQKAPRIPASACDAAFDFWAAGDYLVPLSGRAFVFPGPRQAGLSAGYTHPLTERSKLRLYTRINNLGGQEYYEDGFRTPGRWAVAGVTFSFRFKSVCAGFRYPSRI